MTKQTAIVSLYGKKDARFADFIQDCQAAVRSALGDAFNPYAMGQIHATIVGMERRQGSHNQNRNFWQHQRRTIEMDVDGYINFLRNTPLLPFDVQIGGYEDRDYPFTSDPLQRGVETRPYDRSFVIWQNKVVMMGWPVAVSGHSLDSRRYPSSIENMRRAAQRYGILHGYHRNEAAIDNDLYFRIGLIDSDAGKSAASMQDMRHMLSKRQSLVMSITIDDLFFVRYEDERLPLETTEAKSIANSVPS